MSTEQTAFQFIHASTARKIKEKTLYLGLKFVDNLDLPKDYRLERDILPPNIQ